MRDTDFESIPISSSAEENIRAAKQKLNQLTPSRAGADVSAWFNYSQSHGEASLDFRVPHADHKHPSSIPVDIHALTAEDVFKPGKYSAIRFETLGDRAPTHEKLRRLYGDGSENQDMRELQKQHDKVIDTRHRKFDEIVHDVASSYSGIRVYTDTGDGAFSGNDHRPHVRLQRINTSGEQFGAFVTNLTSELAEFYSALPYDRFTLD